MLLYVVLPSHPMYLITNRYKYEYLYRCIVFGKIRWTEFELNLESGNIHKVNTLVQYYIIYLYLII